MDERQRGVLQKCSDFLIQNITPTPVINNLYSAGILTNDDVIRLTKRSTPNDQNGLLLVDMLPRAGPKAFSSLVTALRETEQSYIADHLLAQMDKGMARDCITSDEQ